MTDSTFLRLFEQIRASRFADLQGARIGASIPISEQLLNALVAASLPRSAKIRSVSIHPQPGDRLSVRVQLARADFLPPLSLSLAIEEQPRLPDSPLVLRVLTLPGLIGMLGSALPIASMLPPGVRMEKDRIYVHLQPLFERHGYADLLPLISSLRIATSEGKLIVEVDAKVT